MEQGRGTPTEAGTGRADPPVKVYGERNTGTNYLLQLLETNLEVRLLTTDIPRRYARWGHRGNRLAHRLRLGRRVRPSEIVADLWTRHVFSDVLGWKHMLVSCDRLRREPLAHEAAFVTLTKNPYSWLLSLFDHPYHIAPATPHATLEQLLAQPWRRVGREGGPKPYASPIDLWNRKNRAYLDLADRFNAANETYEQLIADPEAVVAAVATASGAARRPEYFTNITSSTKGDRERSFEDYQRYYLNEEWRSRLSPEAIRMINASVDRDLMDHFGYQLIEA